MRILRIRPGFQADHSSSSYLFYAVDRPVSAAGQAIAHRFSSRAEVDERTAQYQKWGESSLSIDAYKELLGEHYDVMASESYDWWTLMIAVPKTAEVQALLAPFQDAHDEGGTDVEDYGRRLVAVVHCSFNYEGPVFAHAYDEDALDCLVQLLAKIREEILQGNVSFLQAVSSFYGFAENEEKEQADDEAERAKPSPWSDATLTKAELQQACAAQGITFRKSWTKDQLRTALAATPSGPASRSSRARPANKSKPPKLSKAAKEIVDTLSRP